MTELEIELNEKLGSEWNIIQEAGWCCDLRSVIKRVLVKTLWFDPLSAQIKHF